MRFGIWANLLVAGRTCPAAPLRWQYWQGHSDFAPSQGVTPTIGMGLP